jgi:hypothetical protein
LAATTDRVAEAIAQTKPKLKRRWLIGALAALAAITLIVVQSSHLAPPR